MLQFESVLVTSVLVGIIVWLWILISRSYEHFKHRGIPGPPASFFFGHFKILWTAPFYSRQLQEWTRQYGSVYGLYEGTRPLYVVSDIEFLKQVYITQFSSFDSHRNSFVVRLSESQHLFSTKGERWRRQKRVISTLFSTIKLRLVSSSVIGCIETLMDKLLEMSIDSKQQEFDIYSFYNRFMFDVICKCGFGIDANAQHDPHNEYMHKAQVTAETSFQRLPIVKLASLMPFLQPILARIILAHLTLSNILYQWAPKFIKRKVADTQLTPYSLLDRVQQLISDKSIPSSNEQHRKQINWIQLMLEVKNGSDGLSLTKDEIKYNGLFFMSAAFHTTSTTLANATYILATHQDIQTKLETIVEEHWNIYEQDFNFDHIVNISYLDMFILEVLRMFPVAMQATTRVCNTSTTVCNHQIDEGSVIQPDVLTVHYDPELWGPIDPNIFCPDRHATKRHPAAFLSFGCGPRTCVGMRFAILTIKQCLFYLLHYYTIVPGESMEDNLKPREGFIFQPTSLFVKLRKK